MIAETGIFSATSVHISKAVDMTHLCRKFCFCFCDPCGSFKCLPVVVGSLHLPWNGLLSQCDPWTGVSWETSFLASVTAVDFYPGTPACSSHLLGFLRESWYPAVGEEHCLALELSVQSGRTLGKPCREKMLSHPCQLGALVHPWCRNKGLPCLQRI